MKRDEFKVYIIELLLISILFFTLFAPNIISRIILSLIILIYAIIISKLLKNRKTKSMYKKEIMILMIIFALVYLGIFYLMGLYFGFRQSKITLSIWSIINYIIPLTIIILSSEVIRNILLQQDVTIRIKSKKFNLSQILTYVAMILIDLAVYIDIYNLNNLNEFLTTLGFVLFASLSSNLLYNYISVRYDAKGIIIYKLITTLYMYIIPIVPDVYIFFKSFFKMISPYIIYVIIERLYSKNDLFNSYNERKKNIIGNTILFIVMTLLVMLISCKFYYGVLVVGSNSMMGSIDKGDIVIFEKYTNQNIQKGQVIIFNYNGIQTIHRVSDVKIVNNEYRYYTKGDANKRQDDGYITNDEIYGLVNLKVKYLGYPTIWIRDMFN